jgi:hypothetical protein
VQGSETRTAKRNAGKLTAAGAIPRNSHRRVSRRASRRAEAWPHRFRSSLPSRPLLAEFWSRARRLHRLPFSRTQQRGSRLDGGVEDDVHGTRRGLLLTTPAEHDTNALDEASRMVPYPDRPLTGAILSQNPEYMWFRPYRAGPAGLYDSGMGSEAEAAAEGRSWGWRCAHDARAVKSQTHIHVCGPSCWQYNEAGSRVKICRHLSGTETVFRGGRNVPNVPNVAGTVLKIQCISMGVKKR